MPKQRNSYTHEFKLEAIKLVLEQGRKVPEVTASLNIGKSTLEKWIKQYKDERKNECHIDFGHTDIFFIDKKPVRKGKKRIKLLKLINNFLKSNGLIEV